MTKETKITPDNYQDDLSIYKEFIRTMTDIELADTIEQFIHRYANASNDSIKDIMAALGGCHSGEFYRRYGLCDGHEVMPGWLRRIDRAAKYEVSNKEPSDMSDYELAIELQKADEVRSVIAFIAENFSKKDFVPKACPSLEGREAVMSILSDRPDMIEQYENAVRISEVYEKEALKRYPEFAEVAGTGFFWINDWIAILMAFWAMTPARRALETEAIRDELSKFL